MKKLLLSSIIMLGVCGIAAAQTDAKLAKQKQVASASTISAAPTPQKAAIMPASDDVAPAPKTVADKQAAAAAATAPVRPAKTTQAASTAPTSTTVNAEGVIVPAEVAKPTDVKKNKQ